jgi:toxin ParE1/3/4
MPVLKIKPAAHNDMAEIWCYIAENSSVERADKQIDSIEAKLNLLAGSPKIGRLRPELMESLRSFAAGRYIIFYLPIRNGIEVVRVLHGTRDVDSLFANEKED